MSRRLRRARTRASNETIAARAALEAEDRRPQPQGPSRANKGQRGSGLLASLAPTLREGPEGANKTVEDIELLIVEVEGKPEPEQRPRADTRGERPRIYVPTTAKAWKLEIRKRTRVELLRAGINSAIPVRARAFALGFLFRFARPKSHYRQGRYADQLKPSAPQCHLGVPDLDNLIKAVKDSLGTWKGTKPALLWADDSQVTTYIGNPHKRYCKPGEEPGLTLVVALC